jgi:hypothetical protein
MRVSQAPELKFVSFSPDGVLKFGLLQPVRRARMGLQGCFGFVHYFGENHV